MSALIEPKTTDPRKSSCHQIGGPVLENTAASVDYPSIEDEHLFVSQTTHLASCLRQPARSYCIRPIDL